MNPFSCPTNSAFDIAMNKTTVKFKDNVQNTIPQKYKIQSILFPFLNSIRSSKNQIFSEIWNNGKIVKDKVRLCNNLLIV